MASKNCEDCSKLKKKITVQDVSIANSVKQYFRVCSFNGFGVYVDSTKCAGFEQKQTPHDEECYLFTEEELAAIKNGTYKCDEDMQKAINSFLT